jgi:hypothetical protein
VIGKIKHMNESENYQKQIFLKLSTPTHLSYIFPAFFHLGKNPDFFHSTLLNLQDKSAKKE